MHRSLDWLNTRYPLLQAPMAGPNLHEMAAAVTNAGGLGSLPCALLSPAQLREQVQLLRTATAAQKGPINLNFFCHQSPTPDAAREAAWKERLKPFYDELGVDFHAPTPVSSRAPFD